MSNISYVSGDERLLDDVKELWESLNEHHRKSAVHFAEHYSKFTFDDRKVSLVKKAQMGQLRVDLAVNEASCKYLGYCISSVDNEGTGEIESIYVDEDYRKHGIGMELMERALQWMDNIKVKKKTVTVAAGNENAFGFYEKFGFYPRKTFLEQVKKG
jgi:ribosomal protein S18 acetylase RimI-like enzyme